MRRALLLCLAGALVAPGTALGHVILESSEPATQSRVETPPTEIRLHFNLPVTATSRAIQVAWTAAASVCIVMPCAARYRSTGEVSLISRTSAPAARAFSATS